MDMTIKLQVFEGPLDLLLYLIEKNKVNIYDIPIVEITSQYMEYVAEMKRRDLDVLSEFLVMAATLIDIKSKNASSEDRKKKKKRKKKIQGQNLYSSFLNTKCISVWHMNLKIVRWTQKGSCLNSLRFPKKCLPMRNHLIWMNWCRMSRLET